MRKNQLTNPFLILVCCLLFANAKAQEKFVYSAGLDSVTADGFYKIHLQPALTAQLQPGKADIRLLDASNKQVPYILKSDLSVFAESEFTSLPIVSNKTEADSQLHVVIENTTQQMLHELLLVIKNTNANRMVTISGSNDNQRWYVISENISLDNVFSSSDDTFVQLLSFPNSNYKYISITILGKNKLPVNIVRAGIYKHTVASGRYLPLPAASLLQKDSGNKYSYVFIRFNDYHFIDRVQLEIKGSRYYRRPVSFFTGTIDRPEEQGRFLLSSNSEPAFTLHAKTDHLLLRIQNDDNPPLEITGVKAFQLNSYLLAWLSKGSQYHLVWGDSTATEPSYDLEAFKDSIGETKTLAYGVVRRNGIAVTKEPATSSSRMWIWLSIGAVSVILLVLTFSLTREMNKRNS